MQGGVQVERVTEWRVRETARAISRGFLDNEIWVWLIPSEKRRLRVMDRYYEEVIHHVFIPRGEAWCTADGMGGALWLPPGGHFFTTREQMREVKAMLGAGPAAIYRGTKSDGTMHEHHPSEPHYYLMTLSIHPDRQRRGYGGALLAPLIDRCDSESMPAYLETNRESNIPFYARFGFELTEKVEIPGGPPLWLMWRDPRG